MTISIAVLIEHDVDKALGHANPYDQKYAVVYIDQVLPVFDHKNTPNDCISHKH